MNGELSRENRLLVGIFIGGASSRMGQTKGLLIAPSARESAAGNVEEADETILERTLRVVRAALPSASVCLVGNRSEFDQLAIERLEDARENSGPLGGLVSLLRAAEMRGFSAAISLGSDFPYLTESLVRRLASESPDAAILAPFIDNRYQPLVARYSLATLSDFEAALAGDHFGLQGPLRRLGAVPLRPESGDHKALTDWDTPEDVAKGRERI